MAPDIMEAAVKLPRPTISNLMALILLVALDIWAGKVLVMHGPLYGIELSEPIVVGALPMANVLALGLFPILMPRHESERKRPGLVGFEVGVLAALLIFLACSVTMTHTLHEGVILLPRALSFVPGRVFLVGAVVILLLPQLTLALLGARLSRTYRIRASVTVEKRSPSGTEPEMTTESLVAEGM
jgi:hypothetical protein